ncbi:MAG: 16S rRNA (guanine(527)-N(7))-methyltransferase RsmG [Gammaproteobacteria bacterium]|nr:16S rRNA (guanine(527)-N(7))-methyltransferase RsmG [Gammaproteobacteria bacterium]
MKPEQLLHQGLQTAGLVLPPDTELRLLEFLRLLEKWNQAYSLTAVRDPGQMVTRHLLDSLAVLPYVCGPRVLDIGTGAGLPGVPLALALPETRFTLLDSNAKKTRFVTQAAHALGLANVSVIQMRVEKFQPTEKFTTLLTRAFASIPDMLAATRHLCAPGGCWLAMKGVFPQEELAAIPAEFTAQVRPLRVPGLEVARHVVIIEPR